MKINIQNININITANAGTIGVLALAAFAAFAVVHFVGEILS